MARKAQIITEEGIDYVYKEISFHTEIKDHYYAGDCFVGLKFNKEELEAGILSEAIEKAGMFGFMQKLVFELIAIIGTKSYDGYAFGEDEINFYFLITKKSYSVIIDKLNAWREAKGFETVLRPIIKNKI